MKSSKRLNQSRFKAEARREEWLDRSKLKQPFSTDSDAELFKHLIRGIRYVRLMKSSASEPGLNCSIQC